MSVVIPGFGAIGTPLTDFLNPSAPVLSGAWDVEAFAGVDGKIYAYVSARSESGIQILSIDAAGTKTLVGSVTNAAVGNLVRPTDLKMVDVAGQKYLLVASSQVVGQTPEGTLSVFRVETAAGPSLGALTKVDDISTIPALIGVDNFTTVKAGGKTFIVAFSPISDTLATYEVQAGGTLVAASALTKTGSPALPLDELRDVAGIQTAAGNYLVTVTEGTQGAALWRVGAAGQLIHLDTALTFQDDGAAFNFALPVSVHATNVAGKAFAFIYDRQGQQLLTYEITGNALVYRSQIVLSAAFPIPNDDMNEITSFVYKGQTFLVSSNNQHGSIAILSVDDLGNTTLMNQVRNSDFGFSDPYLANTHGHAVVTLDGRTFVVAASSGGISSGGINLLEVGNPPPISGVLAPVNGTNGDDVIYNFNSSVLMNGMGGNDRAVAGTAAMNVAGGFGIDTLTGGALNDTLRGGTDDDLIAGGGGDDLINGWNAGSGTTNPTHANDSDSLSGGAGNDSLFGGQDNDRLAGGTGNDVLNGDGGDDVVLGGDGDDQLRGFEGSDTLTGGLGADRFIFIDHSGTGNHIVTDFIQGVDRVGFFGQQFDRFAQVLSASTQASGSADTVITLGVNHTVTLVGIDLVDLRAQDFFFT